MAAPPTQATPFPASDDPPESWRPARRLARRALAPVERFLSVQAASGIILLASAVVALAWANSPWHESYDAFWRTPIGFRLGARVFERDLHFWINDGLMTIFFFVVGLEIRREIHRGQLSDLRRAALPLFAAAGGMVVPALIFLAVNHGRATAVGWGIPMATDIAFAVGVLALLGERVPPALRILLLALAVIDDVGAILVIAVFYSGQLAAGGFAVLAAGLVLIRVMQVFGVRRAWSYVPAGALVWAGTYAAGLHPTLAGVVIGLVTPVRSWFGAKEFVSRADASITAMRERDFEDERGRLPYLASLERARREAVSPLDRVEDALHGWVAYGVMPLFALANAGVTLGVGEVAEGGAHVFAGASLGLVLGKPIGILLFSWLACRARAAALPEGVGWRQVGLMGIVAGIGFTMSIFMAGLAFPAGPRLESAKFGVLLASGVAALIGYAAGRAVLLKDAQGAAASAPAPDESA